MKVRANSRPSCTPRRLEDNNTEFTVNTKGSFNDFITNEYLLQSQGHNVSKRARAAVSQAGGPMFLSS